MMVLAYQYMASCSSEYLKEVMDLFSLTALEICEGQQMDMGFESRDDVKEEEYLEMIRLKTAVLLAASLKNRELFWEELPVKMLKIYMISACRLGCFPIAG